MPRRVLVSGNHGSINFEESPAPNEAALQQVMLANPQLLPAADLGLDHDLLVIGRETGVASGRIDLLCLSRSGELVIVEFKTGPQNPDFRHALAQVIDYGADLWRIGTVADLDEGVVRRYLAGPQVVEKYKSCSSLEEAAKMAWPLDDAEWEASKDRLREVLERGDFIFIVAAQRFTPSMYDSIDYLNSTMRWGRFFLVELIRLTAGDQVAHAAQVVGSPKKQTAAVTQGKVDQQAFVDGFPESYRAAVATVLSTALGLGWTLGWGAKGTSLRIKSPDRAEPLSVGWVFPPGDQWYGARHLTLGVDDSSLAAHPSLKASVNAYVAQVATIAGGVPTTTNLRATTFEPSEIPSALEGVVSAMEMLNVSVFGGEDA